MDRKRIARASVIVLLCCSHFVSAKADWVKAPPPGWIRSFPAEDRIPSSSDYPTAGAIYLLDEDIFYVADKIEARVVIMKIFNRRGYRHAEVATPFYHKNESVEVRGRTKRKDGTIIELRQEDVHEILVSKDLKRKRFTLPGIENDCLIQYEIISRSQKYTLSGIRYFQNEEPRVLSRFNLVVPRDLQVIYYDSPPGILDTVEKTPLRSETKALYTFAKRDLFARETEASMPPLFHWSPSLAFSITAPEDREELVASWENISRWYFETIQEHFAPKGEIKKLAKKLTREPSGEKDRIERIFHFVQSHFKADFPSRSIFDRSGTIFNRQVGSSAEVCGILYALLKSVGIESTPVLVPNRGVVMEVPNVPMLDWFTHLLLRVDLEGEELWLDPYQETNSVNCISREHQKVDGLLIQKSEGKLVTTPSVHHSENSRVSVTDMKLSADGGIQCQSREVYSRPRGGRVKSLLRSQTISERRDDLARRICQYCPGAVLDGCNFGDLHDYYEDFEMQYQFASSHYVQKTDGLLFLNPNILNRDLTAKDFSEPTRVFPIMFEQVKTDVDRVVITIPPLCEVIDLPDPIHLENDFGQFQTEYRIQGDSVIYKRTFIIKELTVPASSYKEVKSFFNQIFEEDQKLIVIRRQG